MIEELPLTKRQEAEALMLRFAESIAGRPLTTSEKLDARYIVGLIVGIPDGATPAGSDD